MDDPRRKIAAILLGADVRRELDGIAAPRKLLRKSCCREEMAPGSSGGKQDRACAHAAFSLTLCASASGSADGLRFNCPAIGRLRVSPRAKPMVRAMASRDEPP